MKAIDQLISEGRAQIAQRGLCRCDEWLHANWPDIEAALVAARELERRVSADKPWSTMMQATDAWQRQALEAEALVAAQRLQEGWKEKRLAELTQAADDMGCPPPSSESIAAAGPLFELPFLTLIYDGALQFEWEDKRNYLEVEVHPDGEWRVLHVDAQNASVTAQEAPA